MGSVEGAIGEAVAWDYLTCRTDRVSAVDQMIGGGPDFVFTAGTTQFAVEVKTISSHTVTKRSGLPDDTVPQRGACSYSLLTWEIRQRITGAREQTNGGDLARLVFVVTLHNRGSQSLFGRNAVECVALSTSHLEAPFDPETGLAHPFEERRSLADSVFFAPPDALHGQHGHSAGLAAPWLAGFMLGGFGLAPSDVRVYGALNARSELPLEPAALPDIPWFVVDEARKNEFTGTWTLSEEDESRAARLRAEVRLRRAGYGEWLDKLDARLKS